MAVAAAVPYLAVAAFAMSAAGAYVSYKSSSDQAKLGEQNQAIQRQQAATEARTAALNAREQEAERQRKAELTGSAARAGAAASGFDMWSSPSTQTALTENDRLVQGDLSNISLLGSAQQARYALMDRSAANAQAGYAAAGANAWVAPTVSLLGSAASLGMQTGMADARNTALAGGKTV
jgi:hypothetical protein